MGLHLQVVFHLVGIDRLFTDFVVGLRPVTPRCPGHRAKSGGNRYGLALFGLAPTEDESSRRFSSALIAGEPSPNHHRMMFAAYSVGLLLNAPLRRSISEAMCSGKLMV
ncbi:hypothetical protein [Termitidicoccus mucosus]|uniref:hypothetical protein n=1 Tax=Termitidicoccus mucosus TaxID=1184151 RepID=UPI003182FDD2